MARLAPVLLIVALAGGPALAQRASVAGTDGTNALGSLPCAARSGAALASCPAELLRKDGQNVTIRVLKPGGSVRYIYFRDGKAVSSDSTSAMRSGAAGDKLVIYIDPGEVYEIPRRAVANR